jgi:hypothetical protein
MYNIDRMLCRIIGEHAGSSGSLMCGKGSESGAGREGLFGCFDTRRSACKVKVPAFVQLQPLWTEFDSESDRAPHSLQDSASTLMAVE